MTADVTTDLTERLAVLICYAGFHGEREDTPEGYWAGIAEKPKAQYRQDARRLLAALRSNDWKLVPRQATQPMKDAAINARVGMRSYPQAERVWHGMFTAAKPWFEIKP